MSRSCAEQHALANSRRASIATAHDGGDCRTCSKPDASELITRVAVLVGSIELASVMQPRRPKQFGGLPRTPYLTAGVFRRTSSDDRRCILYPKDQVGILPSSCASLGSPAYPSATVAAMGARPGPRLAPVRCNRRPETGRPTSEGVHFYTRCKAVTSRSPARRTCRH
jgi:hypothetical protein